MGARRLSDERARVHHRDLGDFLAALLLAGDCLAVNAHLRVLAGVARCRSLAARVGINLRIEHEHLDIHAAGKQPRQRLEADVEHCPVAAQAPQRPVRPAHLVPAGANAHRHRRRVFKQRVRPRHEVRVVRIRRGIDRIAAGGGDDAPLVAVLGARRGAHHAQGRPFAAAGARAGAAGIDVRLFVQHHVDQQVVADVPLVRRAEILEQAVALADRPSSPARSWESFSAPGRRRR